ncbi:hypothetical protein V8C42DRAFT_347267 [Trichoderma barbatum]
MFLVGLILTCFSNALSNDPVERSIPTPSTPPWGGSADLSYVSSYEVYETATPSLDEYSSPEPYSFEETWYPPPSVIEPLPTPSPQYSAIVTIRTTTWVLPRSTTITSVILETYYSTLTDFESSDVGGTVTDIETESDPSSAAPCTAASDYLSGYGYECSSSSSPSSSSIRAMTTITWLPEVTPYPPPSVSDEGSEIPTSTSTTSSASSTATATEDGTESPPVVTGAAAPPLQKADTRALGAVAALLAILA